MTDHDDINEIVEIDFEVGHISTIRAEPTTIHNPPRTHDWKVYLRSADVHGDLSCLIQRCVFSLHPEFPNHKRELKSTPFAIQETGYAGFHLPIDIFFKTKKEPKKFRIEYDLDLHTNAEGHPNRQKESHVRKYRCTFSNPGPEFRQKILAAGGKIRDTNSISNNNSDSGDSDAEEEPIPPPLPSEPIVRHSPPQKRPFSPVPTVNSLINKKVKVEQSIINPKKKQQQPVIKNENPSKTIVNNINNKKSQLALSTKPSPIVEEKITKTIPIKDSNINGSTDDSSLSKPRPSSKLKADHDIKPSIQSSTPLITKKKEPVPSPSKMTTQIPIKKPIQITTNKPSSKISIKTEQTSTTNNSPSNVNIKRESSPNIPSSNSTTSTVLISSLKKIPKKVAPPPPPPVIEKRARSPMTPPSSSNRNSDRDSHRHQSSSSKNQSNLKRDRPTTPPPSSSSIHNSNSNRSSSSSNRSGKHSTSTSSNKGRSHSRSRSRSRSRNRSSHQVHHNNRSHHSSNSSRHSSQQKDRSNHHTSPHPHQSSTSKSSSHRNNSLTPTPSKSTRSPSRSIQSHTDLPLSSNDLSVPPPPPLTTSINTPQSRPDSVEATTVPSTTCSPSAHIFHSEDDHTQTPMDIDGQSDDNDDEDTNIPRHIPLSDEQDQISPLSSTFLANNSTKMLTHRNFHSDHSYSLSDTNESNDDSNLSLDGDDDDDDNDLPTVLTDDDLRSKLIYIYNRFTSNSSNDLSIFVTFFKRHHLIDTSSKTTNGMFTYDLFSLNPLLIDELATDLGYTTNSIINRIEQ